MPLEAVSRSARDGFEIYSLTLCFFSGIPLILGDARPGSITAALDPVFQDVWAWMLCAGAAVALAGIFRSRKREHAVGGLIFEQVGLIMCGAAALVYAAVILMQMGTRATIPAAIVSGFGFACVRRFWRIQMAFREAEIVANRRRHHGG